jgi:predicted nuclease of predicted toxin-antitoxin system
VKLLLDHNLSFKLVNRLNDLFPGSNHVYLLGLDKVDDLEIRRHALQNDFIIVTKDADFSDLCLSLGFPPKVIWIRRGNCKTLDIETLLRKHYDDLLEMAGDQIVGILTLF